MQLPKQYETAAVNSAVKPEVKTTHLIFNSLQLISVAKEEIKFGNSAAASLSTSAANDDWAIKELADISIWHFGRGLEKLQEAIRLLDQCKNVNSSIKTKYLLTQNIVECRNLIATTKKSLNRVNSIESGRSKPVRKIVRVARQTLMSIAVSSAKA